MGELVSMITTNEPTWTIEHIKGWFGFENDYMEGPFCPNCKNRIMSIHDTHCENCGIKLNFPKCKCGSSLLLRSSLGWTDGFCADCGRKLPDWNEYLKSHSLIKHKEKRGVKK